MKRKHDKKIRKLQEEKAKIDRDTVRDDEQKDGVFESDLVGLNCYREIESKISEVDGIEELHVNYVPKNKVNKFFRSTGDRYDDIDWSK